jgi:glutathione S-transferase
MLSPSIAVVHDRRMTGIGATLYGIPLSHPVISAQLALAHKGVPAERRMLIGGLHPVQLRLAGFSGSTVPALKLGGRRVEGSVAITRTLEEMVDGPPLYPADPDDRRVVEEAERWGEATLQPVPRRLIRRALTDSHEVRRWFAEVGTPFPAPSATAVALAPVTRVFAARVGASRAQCVADRAALEEMLCRVDALIDDGVIGQPTPNAADVQIAPSVRMLAAFESLRGQVAAHPAADALARRLVPDYPDVPA